jgi:hypothetical protein
MVKASQKPVMTRTEETDKRKRKPRKEHHCREEEARRKDLRVFRQDRRQVLIENVG